MALKIASNIGASIALRALNQSDRAMTASLSKLASGSRVQSAKDDTAALAIGSRLKAELSALKTVSSNATQGIAMLQIAEGAYARATDMTIRLRALATQAASSSLSNTERGMLDTEFQAIKDELDRMAAGTTFNGNQIMNSTFGWDFDEDNFVSPQFTDRILDFSFIDFDGLTGVTFNGIDFADGMLYLYTDTDELITIDFSGATLSGGYTTNRETFAVRMYPNGSSIAHNQTIGSITVDAGFDPFALTYFFISGDPILNITSQNFYNQSFNVGTGLNNKISTNIFGINTTSLGLSSASINSVANAQAAASAATYAIDMIARARSVVAASQNRMESAQKNNATTTENLELARSAYLDLDVAAEMSVFTSKQVLVQAGVSMLAQANQVPKNLLRLFDAGGDR